VAVPARSGSLDDPRDRGAHHDLHYHDQSPEDALELFKWLRRKSYLLIRDLPDSAWASTVYHTENGVMTMDDWLDTYERHIPDHIAQMQAVYEDWAHQQAAR
jgi:hypothetical protein